MGSNCTTEEGPSHFADEVVSKPEKYIADVEL